MACRKLQGKAGVPRVTINLFSMLVTYIFVLALALQVSVGQQQTSGTHRMTLEVPDGINDFNYTEHIPFNDYNSSISFNSRGMSGVYNMANSFIEALIPEVIAEDIIVFNNGNIEIKDGEYSAFAKHYVRYLIFLSALVVFAILMPLCGLGFCCCRCCCSGSGDRMKPLEDNDDFKKIVYATLLIALGTLFLFGIVCSFVTNDNMQDGTNDLMTSVKVSINDANEFFTDTSIHGKILLQDNFIQFNTVIMDTLTNSSDVLFTDLMNITNAASMEDAQTIAKSVTPIKASLTEIRKTTNTLRAEASQLNDATRKIKQDLFGVLKKCEILPQCKMFMDDYVYKLGTEIDFNQIPDIGDYITTLDGVTGLESSIGEGMNELTKVQKKLTDEVQTNIHKVSDAMDTAAEKITEGSDKVLNVLKDISEELLDLSGKGLDIGDHYIKEYSKYRYYVGLAVSCALLIIAVCIALGLICGICGKQPDSYNDNCCNKGVGGRFLMVGVGVMFITSFILVAVLLVHSVGMFGHLLVCEPIQNPKGNTALRYLDNVIGLDELMGDSVSVESVLISCYDNNSAYSVFKLKNKFDLDLIRQYVEDFEIDKLWDEFKEKIKDLKFDGQLLTDDARQEITKLQESDISEIPLDEFEDKLAQNFTTVDLGDFKEELQKLITTLEDLSLPEVVSDLELIKTHISGYISNLFDPMMENAETVLGNIKSIRKELDFNGKDFSQVLESLVTDIDAAESALKTTGVESLMNITDEFSGKIMVEINTYVNRTIGKFENDVGKCGPLALVIKGLTTSTCDKVLAPMDAFWFSIFWCLVLFIPTIIFSVKLSTLYHKSNSLPGTNLESYLYEMYNPGHRQHPGASHPLRDTRYADMAPKHFEDYWKDGPPHYQRVMEDEQPPPYYFSGYGDEN